MKKNINVIIIGGQGIWALSQALTVIVLSHYDSIELVGIYTLGLAFFSPLCLLGSLNLRTLLAIDVDKKLNLNAAYKFRTIVIFSSLIITTAILFISSNDFERWKIAILLVAVRSSDQMSDVATGDFQRSNKHHMIALSYMMRGIASIFPLSIVLMLNGSLLLAAALTLITSTCVTVAFDIVPTLRNSKNERSKGGVRNLINTLGKNLWSAPYPFMDNFHFNSLRYSIFLLASTSVLGVVSAAQTMYAPIQLVISAMGYTYITQARKYVNQKDWQNFRRHSIFGILIGTIPNILFLCFSFLIPEQWLEIIFNSSGIEIKNSLILIAIAMLPLGVCGFITQLLVVLGRQKAILIAPTVGLFSFIISLEILKSFNIKIDIQIIIILFTASGIIRLALNLSKIKKYIQNHEA